MSAELGHEVWIKRDDLTNPVHGGNKVRKLRLLLREAHERGASHVITIGAAGSNHVLSTAIHGRASGLSVIALVLSHPYSQSAHHKTAAAVAADARLLHVPHPLLLPVWIRRAFADVRRQGGKAYLIPAGGTGRAGTSAYSLAAAEFNEQLSAGEIPGWPAEAFVALGSGGTAAGLWNGFSRLRAPTRLHAVRVVSHRLVGRALLRFLSDRADGKTGYRSRLKVDVAQLGSGYGRPTEAGAEAAALFAQDDIHLDPTYTAKAGAALIAHARRERPGGLLLFWQTLSAVHPFDAQKEPEPLPDHLGGIWL